MKGALFQHDLMMLWRSRWSIVVQSLVAICLLLMIARLWTTKDVGSMDTGMRGRELFKWLGSIITLTTVIWTPLSAARLLHGGRDNSALALAVQISASPWPILRERFMAWLLHALLPAIIALPIVTACYTIGSVDMQQLILMYFVIVALTANLVAIGLWGAVNCGSAPAVARRVYGAALLLIALALVPVGLEALGMSVRVVTIAKYATLLSPVMAVMQIVRIGSRQMIDQSAAVYVLTAALWSALFLWLATRSMHARSAPDSAPRISRLNIALPKRWRHFGTSSFSAMFVGMLLFAMVLGYCGSRRPGPQTTAALAAIVTFLSMLLALLGAPGLTSAIVATQRKRMAVLGLPAKTATGLVLAHWCRATIPIVLLIAALTPASVVVTSLDLQNTWSLSQFLAVMAMFTLTVCAGSIMIGSWFRQANSAYLAAYTTAMLLLVVPLVLPTVLPATSGDRLAPLLNYCPTILVVDKLALGREPIFAMTAHITPYFSALTVTCLLITLLRVLWMKRIG